MITRDEVKKLADLARVEVPEGEMDQLAKDLESILGYVSELKNVPMVLPAGGLPMEEYTLINVLREDENAHESGIYTNDLVTAFSKSRNNYLSVKPILDKNVG